jgi:carboxyl-terminal processing protease
LNDLISIAKKEKYYDQHEDIFSELQKELDHSLETDLMIFKREITGLLEDEILNRYFYEEGSIEWSLDTDIQVLKAVDILNRNQDYNSILQGKKGPVLITHEDNTSSSRLNLVKNHDSGIYI